MNTKQKKTAALSHLDTDGHPAMVDVSAKAVTARVATAECRVQFPAAVAVQLRKNAMKSAKGGVVDTAIVAGTLAVKRTHELIPFCHPLPVENCEFQIIPNETGVAIRCEVSTTGKTGVEMEAMTGASVAALTVYDMCKALNKAIRILDLHLISKTGGKSGDFHA